MNFYVPEQRMGLASTKAAAVRVYTEADNLTHYKLNINSEIQF